MLLSMEYGDFKPHEADVFELDHMIAYKQSSKFNLRNVSIEVNFENFLPRKLPTIQYQKSDVNVVNIKEFLLLGGKQDRREHHIP